jgi:hypothetical protein
MESFACGIVIKAQGGRALAVMTEIGRAEAVSEGPRRSAESRYMPESSVGFRRLSRTRGNPSWLSELGLHGAWGSSRSFCCGVLGSAVYAVWVAGEWEERRGRLQTGLRTAKRIL